MEIYHDTPFAAPLVKCEFTQFHPKILGIKGRNDVLIRVQDRRVHNIPNANLPGFTTAKRLFEEVKANYGINIPTFTIILVTSHNGEPPDIFYTCVNRVYGQNFEKGEFTHEQLEVMYPQVDAFYSSIIQYVEDKYKKEEPYLTDIKNRQLVFGREQNEEEDKLYFVDLDPHYSAVTVNDYTTSESDYFFGEFLHILYIEMLRAENILEGRILRKGREKFRAFLESLPLDIPYYEIRIKPVLDILRNTGIEEI